MRVGCNEPGNDQRADELWRHQRRHLRPGLVPAHAGSHRTPLHQQRLAGVEPLHVTRRAAAQQALEQARRPDFAVARDEIAHRGRCVAYQPDRLQDARDVAAVEVERGDVFVAELARKQLARDVDVALTQLLQSIVECRQILLGEADQREQRIGHAPAGRKHHRLARRRIVLDDFCHADHARGVGDARTAELVDFPGLHASDSLFRSPAVPPTLPLLAVG